MSTPDKYKPEPRKYEQKDWLYEQYWGEMQSQKEIAADLAVSRGTIRDKLHEHGIPTRRQGCDHDSVNPFGQFYTADEIAPAPVETRHYFDPEKVNSTDTPEQRLDNEASEADTVSLDWHKQYAAKLDTDTTLSYQWSQHHTGVRGIDSSKIDRVYRHLQKQIADSTNSDHFLQASDIDSPISNYIIGRALTALLSCPYCPLNISIHAETSDGRIYRISVPDQHGTSNDTHTEVVHGD